MKRSSSFIKQVFKVLVLFSSLVAFNNCNTGIYERSADSTRFEIKNADWLLGRWVTTEDTGISVEDWEKFNDSVYKGISYYINSADTTVIERLILKQSGDSMYYSALVIGQNDGLPIQFVVTQLSDSGIVIENLAHDFPNHISYTKKPGDSLIALVSGSYEGKDVSIKIAMKKSK